MNWKKLLSANKVDIEKQRILLLPVTLELDEQGSFVGNKSNQRWLWLCSESL
ncbi:TPA: IS1 family transposase [Legionella anisa]